MAVHFGQLPHLPLVCVDNFKSRTGSARKFFFLTHFHSDHYFGLDQSFDEVIYCSTTTKKLILNKFPKISLNRIISLEVGVPRCLKLTEDVNINVTLYDSNHCPGSVMILLEGFFGRYLHTGDFRFSGMSSSHISQFVECDKLILDTTFAHPLWNEFPSKEEAIHQIISIIEDHCEESHVFLECDMLGTEQILFELAKHFHCLIHVDKDRCKELECIDSALSCFTTDPKSSRFHVVQVGTCEKMQDAILQRKSNPNKRLRRNGSSDVSFLGEEDEVVLIKPSTQWFGMQGRQPVNYKNRPCLKDGIWHVLYSIHSSHSEIIEFLKAVQPKSIAPLTECEPEVLKMISHYATNQNSSQEIITPPSLLKECQISSTQHYSLHMESKTKISNLKNSHKATTSITQEDDFEFCHVTELLKDVEDEDLFISQSKLTSVLVRKSNQNQANRPQLAEPASTQEEEEENEDELFLSSAKITSLIKKPIQQTSSPADCSSQPLEESECEDLFLTQVPKEDPKFSTPSPISSTSPVKRKPTTQSSPASSSSPSKCFSGGFFPSPSPNSSPATSLT